MGATRLKSRRRQEQGSKFTRVTIAILSTIGAIDTGSITFNRWGLIGSLACPGGKEGCDTVLNSPWGTIFANENLIIPLSFLGLISYLTILLLAILTLMPIGELRRNIYIERSWWGIFSTSLAMSVFSLVLIGLMIFKIEAFCFFCVLSGLLSILIFILSIRGGLWDNHEQLLFRGILISLAILLSSLIWSSSVDPGNSISNRSLNGSPPPVISSSNPRKIEFAKYLSSKNIFMYSAYWCPHCHDQKELFGQAASKELNIIECAEDGLNSQSDLCDKKGISSYPSWEINGEIEEGVKSLEELATLSNYNPRLN